MLRRSDRGARCIWCYCCCFLLLGSVAALALASGAADLHVISLIQIAVAVIVPNRIACITDEGAQILKSSGDAAPSSATRRQRRRRRNRSRSANTAFQICKPCLILQLNRFRIVQATALPVRRAMDASHKPQSRGRQHPQSREGACQHETQWRRGSNGIARRISCSTCHKLLFFIHKDVNKALMRKALDAVDDDACEDDDDNDGGFERVSGSAPVVET